MGLSTQQALFKCCGFYCAMLAGIGVYFYLVMAYFQSINNNFLIMELEEFQDATAENYDKSTWVNAFLITAFVSLSPV
jgi:hypothetical protein